MALRSHKHHVEDMQSDFDEYGDNYTIIILEENVGFKDRYKEYQWMEKYQSHIRGKGYNYNDPHFVIRSQPKHLITFNGETKALSQWALDMNLPYQTLYQRIFVKGWDVEKALTMSKEKPVTKEQIVAEAKELTKQELELAEIIRKSDNPQMALYTALGIITDFINSDN